MNKKLMTFGLLGILSMTLVVASYLVYSATVTQDIAENFDNIGFGIVGDDTYPDWATATDCGDITTFVDIDGLTLDTIYPGESRTFCGKFDNLANADAPYTMEVTTNNVEVAGDVSTGTILALATDYQDGVTIVVDSDATPIVGLTATATVTRE